MNSYISRLFALLLPALVGMSTLAGTGFAMKIDDFDGFIDKELKDVDKRISEMLEAKIASRDILKNQEISLDEEDVDVSKNIESEALDADKNEVSENEVLRQDIDVHRDVQQKEFVDADSTDIHKNFANSKSSATRSAFERGFESIKSFEKAFEDATANEDTVATEDIVQRSITSEDLLTDWAQKSDFFEQLIDNDARKESKDFARDVADIDASSFDKELLERNRADIEEVDKFVDKGVEIDKSKKLLSEEGEFD